MELTQNNLSSTYDQPANEKQVVKAVYWIEGLFCGNCAKSLENKITTLGIVKTINVNFTYSYMIVDHYGDLTQLEKLEQTIKDLGYKLTQADLTVRKQQLEQQQKKSYGMLFFAFIFSMWSMLCAVVTYMHGAGELTNDTVHLLNMSSGLFSIPVIFIAGFHFHKMAWLALCHRLFNIDLLIATSALSAFFISLYFLWHQIDVVYFDTACMLILLHLFGRTLDLNTKTKALQCLEQELEISRCKTVFKQNGKGELITVDVNQIKAGDIITLHHGDKLPVDGELITSIASFSTSVLTGESTPVDYQHGQALSAGFFNVGQTVTVRVTCSVGSSATDYQLIDILTNKAKQASHNDKINQLSSLLSKLILIASVSAGVFIYATHADLQLAFERILCVLVIACPCSLTIAMPMASLILNRQSVKRHIVINNNANFLKANHLTSWYFDKTGTLTSGKPKIKTVALLTYDVSVEELLNYAYQCVYHSGHIYSNLVREYIVDRITPSLQQGEHREILGSGIQWQSDDNKNTVTFASKKWLEQQAITTNYQETSTASYLVVNGQVIAVFEFEDTLKQHATETVSKLSQQVKQIGMLSGDNPIACQHICRQTNIEPSLCHSGLSPQQKQEFIQTSTKDGQYTGFIGDGLNDNLALMQADIGVATKNANALTKMSATVCLLTDDIRALICLKPLANLYQQLVKRNLIFAVTYNLIAIPVAILGNVSPLVAIFAMAASSLSILINSFIFNEKMENL